MKQEVVDVVKELIVKNPDIRAFVFE